MTDPLDPWHVMTFARVSFWRSFRVSFIFALLTDKERTRPILLVAGRQFLHKVVYGTSLPAALFLYPTSESRLFLSSRAVASADVDYETGRLVVINIMRRKAVGRNIIHLLLFEHTRWSIYETDSPDNGIYRRQLLDDGEWGKGGSSDRRNICTICRIKTALVISACTPQKTNLLVFSARQWGCHDVFDPLSQSFLYFTHCITVVYTGVDLSKILGGQTKILGDKKVVKMINAWAILNYWAGHVPGLPPKSTPMVVYDLHSLRHFITEPFHNLSEMPYITLTLIRVIMC